MNSQALEAAQEVSAGEAERAAAAVRALTQTAAEREAEAESLKQKHALLSLNYAQLSSDYEQLQRKAKP